jgi:hypothetical protein
VPFNLQAPYSPAGDQTDLIPSFTIAWFIRKNAIEKSFAKIG